MKLRPGIGTLSVSFVPDRLPLVLVQRAAFDDPAVTTYRFPVDGQRLWASTPPRVVIYREGRRERAVAIHDDLLPLLNVTIQDVEMFIHYEKRMLEALGTIDAVHSRDPSYTPDSYDDERFEGCFATVDAYR